MSYKHEAASYAGSPPSGQGAAREPADSCDTDLALAYAAGFIDGEGCIHIARQRRRGYTTLSYRARLTVAQSNREILEHIREVLGEPAQLVKVRRTEIQNRQPYTLVWDGRHAGAALRKVLPHLRLKLPEARMLLRYLEECDVRVHPGPQGHAPEVWTRREKFYQKLRRLK